MDLGEVQRLSHLATNMLNSIPVMEPEMVCKRILWWISRSDFVKLTNLEAAFYLGIVQVQDSTGRASDLGFTADLEIPLQMSSGSLVVGLD